MGRVDRRRGAVLAGIAVLVVALVGCAERGPADRAFGIRDVAQGGAVEIIQPRLTVNPPDGAAGVSPTEAVTVAVTGGQLTQVQLRVPNGPALDGAISPDGETWASIVPMVANTSYVLSATARSAAGQETTTTSRFTTLADNQRVAGKISPNENDTVAVDRAVSVTFDKPIGDRAVVERALRVTSNPAATGSTEWRSDRELLWRPTPAWSPGSRVTVSLDVFGKQLGNGLVGAADLRTSFAVVESVGASPVQAVAPSGSAIPSSSPLPSPGLAPSARLAPSASRPPLPRSRPAPRSVRPTTSSASPRPPGNVR